MFGSDREMRLALSGGKVLGTILRNIDRIAVGVDVGTEQVSLDGSFHFYNGGKREGLLLVGSLGYTDDKFLSTDEGIKLISVYGKVFVAIPEDVCLVKLGIDVET